MAQQATPTDLARVSVHLLRILNGEITGGVLSPGMLEQMLTPDHDGAEGFNNQGLFYATSEDEWFELADGDVMKIERDDAGNVVGAVNDGKTRLIKR